MNQRKPLPDLPPPTFEERARAWIAAAILRGALDEGDPAGWGQHSWLHVNRGRKQHLWISTWPQVAGLHCCNGEWTHDMLPGWQYTWPEVRREMLPDLYALAERGERPSEVTSR